MMIFFVLMVIKNLALNECVFKSVFSYQDQNRITLEYAGCKFGKPTHDQPSDGGVNLCHFIADQNSSCIMEKERKTGERLGVKDVKEQNIFVRDIPLMTDRTKFYALSSL